MAPCRPRHSTAARTALPRDVSAAPAIAYRERHTPLRPGDTLLLYTDGLIERRHDDLGAGLERLVAEAERLAGRAPDRLVDGLLSAATGDTDDDTSLIAIRVV